MYRTVLYCTVTQGVFDCLTGPCVVVPGVGKLQGSTRPSQFTGRDVHHFLQIPFGESTAGEHRFAPPRPKGPLNDGDDAYDASYTSYILGWWNHVCPQPGPGITGQDSPLVNQFRAEQPELAAALPTGPLLGSEDCLHLAVFTPELPSAEHDPRLPVMVYIHGGAFMLGGYVGAGPGKLLERDMVLVALQYRVGPLGKCLVPAASAECNLCQGSCVCPMTRSRVTWACWTSSSPSSGYTGTSRTSAGTRTASPSWARARAAPA